ncbi:MAG: AbrB/MazE/SpoVT family DNA-binding domain-containing protein [Acidobacteria bacterium]|nr:AbrB/MazE/SpoVT family DNA-binding domain-containing protein [Acidobacteriota bacterium]
MAVQAKITSKGQITVPLKVRRQLGVKPGDSLIFDDLGDAVTVRPARRKDPFAKYLGIEKRGRGASRHEIIAELRKMRDEQG